MCPSLACRERTPACSHMPTHTSATPAVSFGRPDSRPEERGEEESLAARHLLEQIKRVLQAGLHARLDDHVADFLARRVDDERERRAMAARHERYRVHRTVVRYTRRRALVNFRAHEALVRHDLAVDAVKANRESILRHHHVTPFAAYAKTD